MDLTNVLQDMVDRDRDHECEGFGKLKICVRVVGFAALPTQFGNFRIIAFWNNRDSKEHVAIVHGNVIGQHDVPTRLHSECLTGDALGSLRCDCREQLALSLRRITDAPCGMVLYLRQEGRGIGLINKVRAYQLQDQGLDTVEANRALGFRDDERDFAVAAHMVHSLGVKSLRLMTNNPKKIQELQTHGIEISGRIPHVIEPNEYNEFYLQTKALRSGHLLPAERTAVMDEQGDPLKLAYSEDT